MIPGSGLYLLGISGFLIFYAVLAHLSARMGEGLRVPGYYRIYYIAILFLISGALLYIFNGEGSEDIMMILLITGNVLAVAASYRYWWWLKDELWIKKGKGEE
jgi:TRAP-type mannitol/chloroaromatic compound transport system permease small subunit